MRVRPIGATSPNRRPESESHFARLLVFSKILNRRAESEADANRTPYGADSSRIRLTRSGRIDATGHGRPACGAFGLVPPAAQKVQRRTLRKNESVAAAQHHGRVEIAEPRGKRCTRFGLARDDTRADLSRSDVEEDPAPRPRRRRVTRQKSWTSARANIVGRHSRSVTSVAALAATAGGFGCL